MNRFKKVLPIALIAVFVFSATAMASYGGRGEGNFQERPQLTEEEREINQAERETRKAEVQAVMETGNYNAWAELVAEHPHGEKMLEVINEGNFNTFVAAHQKIQEGHEMLEELGLEHPGKKGMRNGRGMHRGMQR